jgi:ureidoglycolate hydrolase
VTQVVRIGVKPVTEHSFAPFGQLIGLRESEPNFHGNGLRSWRLNYGADGETELMYIWFDYMPMRFSKLERHFNVTQAFVPLNGVSMIMVVAPGTDPANWEDVPAPESVQAFLIPGDCGVMLWKGVWHALNRYPIKPPGGGFALLTTRETQNELERQLHTGYQPQLTQAVDYETRFDVRFEAAT